MSPIELNEWENKILTYLNLEILTTLPANEQYEKVLQVWTNGDFQPVGSIWQLKTKDGIIDLYRDDLVHKDLDTTYFSLYKRAEEYRWDRKKE